MIAARELVIDPTVSYSTYFGGSGSETYPSIAVNGDGFIYLAGSTTSTDLPVASSPATPKQSTLNGAQNIFILKLDPTAGAAGILYLTYLGGSGTDISSGLAVDTGGTAYVTGTTTSTNFPTSAAGFQTTPLAGTTCTPLISTISAPCHVFVSALSGLDSTGSPQLKYSTYLSGNGSESASAVATDNNSNVFVTGTTTSTNSGTGFPSTSLPAAYQASSNGSIQFFMTEVNTNATGLPSIAYSTYFGGSNGSIAVGGGIAVDTTGNVYFSGTTNFYNSGEGPNGGILNSTDFPILNAWQPCLNTPEPITILPPVSCPAVTTPEPTDAFVAKLNVTNAQTSGPQLIYSTFFGGNNNDSSTGLTIDSGAANVYITGTTNSSNITLPSGAGAFQPCLNAPTAVLPCSTTPDTTHTDAYVARFANETGSTTTSSAAVPLGYFSYLGGSLNDSGLAIAVDTAEGALVTGATNSTDFPASVGAIQTHLNGTQNAFFAHLDTQINSSQSTVGSYATYFGGNGTDRGTSITVDSSLNTYFAGDTNSNNLQLQGPVQNCLDTPVNPAPGTPCPTITAPAPTDAFAVRLQTATDLCIRCVAPILSPNSQYVSAGNQLTITFTVINEGPDLATNITVTGQLSPA